MNENALTVQIHFPFYPGVYSKEEIPCYPPTPALMSAYVQALQKEITAAASDLAQQPIASVRISGSPCQLGGDALSDFLLFLGKALPQSSETQWGLELLPVDLSAAMLTVLRNAHVDVLLMDVGTTRMKEFPALARPYYLAAFDGALSLTTMYRQKGLHVGLCVGLPEQTPQSLAETIDSVLLSGCEGISLYPYHSAYTVCQGFSAPQVPPAQQALFDAAAKKLAGSGFLPYGTGHHYALPGKGFAAFECSREKMGFGAGAVTTLDGLSYKNTCNLQLYLNHSDQPDQIACKA